jgi:hypothetical protein
VAVLALFGGAVRVLLRRARQRSAGASPAGSGEADTDLEGIHDRTAATDGVAAMTKEHSNGTH